MRALKTLGLIGGMSWGSSVTYDKVIKRKPFSFRDDDDFFLNIRAAFPGIPGWS
jgi:hypothetical protein